MGSINCISVSIVVSVNENYNGGHEMTESTHIRRRKTLCGLTVNSKLTSVFLWEKRCYNRCSPQAVQVVWLAVIVSKNGSLYLHSYDRIVG